MHILELEKKSIPLMSTEEIFFNINVASDYLPIVSLFCNKG
jgi:hypothetical protein